MERVTMNFVVDNEEAVCLLCLGRVEKEEEKGRRRRERRSATISPLTCTHKKIQMAFVFVLAV